MSTFKKIQINPDLFKLSDKTRKKRDSSNHVKITPSPSISTNKLKKKLLTRIKDHKTNEFKHLSSSSSNTNTLGVSDEFNDAIHFLNDLKQKRTNEIVKEKHHKMINNTTVKNYNTPAISHDSVILPTRTTPYVEIELPTELQEPSFHINTYPQSSHNLPVITNNQNMVPLYNNTNLTYIPDKDIPYGCLKNGIKPSYRTFTRKNPDIYTHHNPNVHVQQSDILEQLSREQRLDNIKQKLKQIQEKDRINQPIPTDTQVPMPIPIIANLPQLDDSISTPQLDVPINLNNRLSIETPNKNDIDKQKPISSENSKTFIKKTIKRKYTLGKKNGRVGVLIKDNQTRKKMMKAYNELKKTDMSDVRKHLRNNGLIKVGSTAPNDILRKTFESVMLSGDIINTNSTNKLYNFTHDTDSTNTNTSSSTSSH